MIDHEIQFEFLTIGIISASRRFASQEVVFKWYCQINIQGWKKYYDSNQLCLEVSLHSRV